MTLARSTRLVLLGALAAFFASGCAIPAASSSDLEAWDTPGAADAAPPVAPGEEPVASAGEALTSTPNASTESSRAAGASLDTSAGAAAATVLPCTLHPDGSYTCCRNVRVGKIVIPICTTYPPILALQ